MGKKGCLWHGAGLVCIVFSLATFRNQVLTPEIATEHHDVHQDGTAPLSGSPLSRRAGRFVTTRKHWGAILWLVRPRNRPRRRPFRRPLWFCFFFENTFLCGPTSHEPAWSAPKKIHLLRGLTNDLHWAILFFAVIRKKNTGTPFCFHLWRPCKTRPPTSDPMCPSHAQMMTAASAVALGDAQDYSK